MPTTTRPAIPTSPRAVPALEFLREELLALDPDVLAPLNVDIAAAALVVMGAASEIRPHRAALVALCGEQMAASVDRLELVAGAALEAQAAHRGIQTGAELQTLSEEVVEMRAVLLAEVRALIARKVVSAGATGELRGAHGFKNQCLDVLQLVSVLKTDWERVGAETGIKRAYIDRAEAAASALAMAVGARNQAVRSPTADLRQRAFTLMATTYDDARRMMTFLRWKDGDADRIAPSFFRGRGNGRRRVATAAPAMPVAPPSAND